MPEWILAVADGLTGTNRTFIDGLDFTIARNRDGGSVLTTSVEARDPRVAELLVGKRAIKAYRGGVLRFHGKIWEPLRHTADLVHVEARSPFAGVVMNRRVRALTTFTNVDLVTIATSLITTQNGFSPTRLVVGSTTTTSNASRSIEPGKSVGEAIVELTQVASSFTFRETPIETAGVQAEINFLRTSAVAVSNALVFEFGESTTGKLRDYEVVTMLPRNRITARGQTEAGAELISTQQDAASIAEWDLYEDDVAFGTPDLQATVDAHAAGELRAAPPQTFSVTPGPESPMLWDSFDVADKGRFRVVNGPLDLSGSAWINSATVKVSKNGAETLESLVLQSTADPSVKVVGNPAKVFDRYTAELERRIAQLERR